MTDFTILIKSSDKESLVYVENDICQVKDLALITNCKEKVIITITSTNQYKQKYLTFENLIFIKIAESYNLKQWLSKYSENNPILITVKPSTIISQLTFKNIMKFFFDQPLCYAKQKDNFKAVIAENVLQKLQKLGSENKNKVEVVVVIINTFTLQQSGSTFQQQDKYNGPLFSN